MYQAIYPGVGKPWIIGLHRCDDTRWSEQARWLFQQIGRRIANQLTTMLAVRNLNQAKRDLSDIQRNARLGSWRYDLVSDEIHWSDASWRLLGRMPEPITAELAFSIIHPDDHVIVFEAMEAAQAGQALTEHEFRFFRPNGEIGVMHNRWHSIYDESGQELYRVGTHQDITARRQAENKVD